MIDVCRRALMLGAVISLSVQAGFSKKPLEQGPYEANWTSLSKHQPVPEWLRDAKFGIYCHWGVYSVPAYGNEQYFHYMHCDASSSEYAKGEQFLMGERERQEAIYGPLSEFGYHDFIPMFKAERAFRCRPVGAAFQGGWRTLWRYRCRASRWLCNVGLEGHSVLRCQDGAGARLFG